MDDLDIFHLIDYCADHIMSFECWPVDFENTENGMIWDYDVYQSWLKTRAPATYLLLHQYLEDRLP